MPSTNLEELTATVEMEIPGPNAKFEFFGTPEADDSVPGPTFAMTLVAEFDAPIQRKKSSTDARPDVWVAPNTGREWLSEPFRALIEKYANKRFPTDTPDCAPFAATLKKSRQTVNGFQCSKGGKLLVYVPIWRE